MTADTEKPIVFMIDDDPGVRTSLSMTLAAAGFDVKEYPSAERFLAESTSAAVGCMVLDLRLGGMSGLELLQHMRRAEIHIPVIMITGHGDISVAVQTMKLGAVDFVEKPLNPRALVERVQTAIRGEIERREANHHRIKAAERLASLSVRELEVLRHLAVGRSSKQIAVDLQISANTVDNHRAHMLEKTGAENIADLVRLATLAGKI